VDTRPGSGHGDSILNPNHMVLGVDFILGDMMEAPPACPEGFERAEDNEYVLLKLLPICSARSHGVIKTSCCGDRKVIRCAKLKVIVTRKHCLVCEAPIISLGV